ncbi:hypothetical protein DACRYDRAFT_52476 [Dacryopinax primogenitus]|uniref:Aminoglycoside phosphotransferase domain-containing protein n=1 Tax=Dacryopinax primogenitus (strain DJM 731) TaxID=1858805 RepID=M5G7B1_DACPD|nr:uncharacterized protein DACRYDRAFT_52476 [Dacryopinax primogenitus]EJU01707.1 hypothetical protein DACRYDRAFT_52476 [Dacryopinax primogenitus]
MSAPTPSPSPICYVFEKSTFFQNNPHACLPTPAEVRAQCKFPGASIESFGLYPPPARFPHLGLLVKFGHGASVTEGECLAFLRRQGITFAPEIYGWTTEGDVVYLYMELIPGVTLSQRWDWLSASQKEAIALELNEMMGKVRCVHLDSSTPYIGSVGRRPLQDRILEQRRGAPLMTFDSVTALHDFFMRPTLFDPTVQHPHRGDLPDDVEIQLTHGDLHLGNIIVSAPSWWTKEGLVPHVMAIVDWHQAGWMPSYWEYCKALWTVSPDREEWATAYLPKIIDCPAVVGAWLQRAAEFAV